MGVEVKDFLKKGDIELIPASTYHWHRLRSMQRLLRLSDKYGPSRTASVCRKAKEYGILELILSDKVKRRHARTSED